MSSALVSDLEQYRAGLVERINQSVLLPEWPECRSALLDETISAFWAIRLAIGSCLAVGGKAETAYPVAAAWTSLNVAAHLLDQAQDGEVPSRSKAESLSVGLIFAAYDFLADVPPSHVNQVMRIFSGAGYGSILGQTKGFALERDVSPATALEQYWETVILKSGSLIKMATAGGAAVATHDQNLIQALAGYGEGLGIILQILDDCRDVLDDHKRYEISLPVLLYSSAAGSQTVVFPQAQTRDELVKVLEETGTLQAISNVLLHWQQRCLECLEALPTGEAVDALKAIVTRTLNQAFTQG